MIQNWLFQRASKKILGLAMVLVALSGCIEDETWDLDNVDESVNISFDLAAPIGKGSASFIEAFDEWGVDTTQIKFDHDSLLYFDYWNDFDISNFMEVNIPDQDSVVSINPEDLPFTSFPLPGGLSFNADTLTVAFEMHVEGGDLYSLLFESGIFGIESATGFGTIPGINESYNVTIPGLSKNGVVFSHTFDGSNFSGTKLFDLDGYKLDFVRGLEEILTIKIAYSVTNTTSNAIMLTVTEPISFTMRLNSIEPDYVVGFLNTTDLVEEAIDVKIPILSPDYVQDFTILFFDPKIEIFLENWVGMPFDVTLKNLLAVNTETGDSVDVQYQNNVIEVGAATSTEVSPNNFQITSYKKDVIVDRTNSQIDNVLNKVYNKAYIAYCITPNPDGYLGVDNFLKASESTQMTLSTHTILPLWAKIDDYGYNDTLDFDFQEEILNDLENDTATINNLDSLVFILSVNNRIPIDLSAQIYIVDEDGIVIDKLFADDNQVIIAASPIDENGISSGASNSQMKFVYDESKYDKWESGKKLIFDVKVNSAENEYVQMHVNLGLDYKLGFYLKGKVTNDVFE